MHKNIQNPKYFSTQSGFGILKFHNRRIIGFLSLMVNKNRNFPTLGPKLRIGLHFGKFSIKNVWKLAHVGARKKTRPQSVDSWDGGSTDGLKKKAAVERKIGKILKSHIFASIGPTERYNPLKWGGKGHCFRLEPQLLCFVLYFKANSEYSVANCSFFYPTNPLWKIRHPRNQLTVAWQWNSLFCIFNIFSTSKVDLYGCRKFMACRGRKWACHMPLESSEA